MTSVPKFIASLASHCNLICMRGKLKFMGSIFFNFFFLFFFSGSWIFLSLPWQEPSSYVLLVGWDICQVCVWQMRLFIDQLKLIIIVYGVDCLGAQCSLGLFPISWADFIKVSSWEARGDWLVEMMSVTNIKSSVRAKTSWHRMSNGLTPLSRCSFSLAPKCLTGGRDFAVPSLPPSPAAIPTTICKWKWLS